MIGAFPLLYQLAGMGDLLRRQQTLAAHPHTTSHSRGTARPHLPAKFESTDVCARSRLLFYKKTVQNKTSIFQNG